MSTQSINTQAEATREQHRSPDGKFGTQPAAEVTGDVLTGTVEDDLASVTDPDRADDRNGEVARLVAARETLRQCLRSSFPGATQVTMRQDKGDPGPHLASATGADGETIDLTDPTSYPADGAYYSYDAAVEHGASSWDATVVDEVYGPEVDGVRTLDLEVDHPDDPWGEDWYDPDLASVQAQHEQIQAAYDRLGADDLHQVHMSHDKELDRLTRGREAIREVFRAHSPDTTRVCIDVDLNEHDRPAFSVSHAVDAEGNDVDLDSGWSHDLDRYEVDSEIDSIMRSSSESASEKVFPYSRGYWVEI